MSELPFTLDKFLAVMFPELFGVSYEEACQQAELRGVFEHADIRQAMTTEAFTALDKASALVIDSMMHLNTIPNVQVEDYYQTARDICKTFTRKGKITLWKEQL